jgi:hypothetical protein
VRVRSGEGKGGHGGSGGAGERTVPKSNKVIISDVIDSVRM